MLLSEDGHLDIAEALRRIQRAGVRPSIKGVVVMIQITLLKSEISLDSVGDKGAVWLMER
ncbi:hypothetical protein F8388_013283 [Cannabis sativa]|uniref:Uncharacterized protein n=1 Tax=Cannabis sativa TaxID=3483 RepID=A0A7J6EDA1_CANSA|nr:hypothetical protein F8388_013283 [Cannabis sativa]